MARRRGRHLPGVGGRTRTRRPRRPAGHAPGAAARRRGGPRLRGARLQGGGGKAVAGYAAYKDHLSYLPHSGTVLSTLEHELDGLGDLQGRPQVHRRPPAAEGPGGNALVSARLRELDAGLDRWPLVPGEGPRMASVDEHISIGQFASLTWLSPKALRLYQAQGLLWTGGGRPQLGVPLRARRSSRPRADHRAAAAGRHSLAEIAAYLQAPNPEPGRARQDAGASAEAVTTASSHVRPERRTGVIASGRDDRRRPTLRSAHEP